jgi:uncharacterized integral membrane protein (TIGR00697 family)
MYNELVFFAHIVVVTGSVLLALRHSYGALLTVLALQMIVANLFVTKQIGLFGFHTTTSEVFVVSGMFGIGVVREYYGFEYARRCVWMIFGFFLLFTVLVQFHCAYTGFEPLYAEALALVCTSTVRLFIASMLAYLVSERIHLALTYLMPGRYYKMLPLVGGQIVDTGVFAVVGLWGLVDSLWSVIAFSLLVKGIIIVSLAPVLLMTHRLYKGFI